MVLLGIFSHMLRRHLCGCQAAWNPWEFSHFLRTFFREQNFRRRWQRGRAAGPGPTHPGNAPQEECVTECTHPAGTGWLLCSLDNQQEGVRKGVGLVPGSPASPSDFLGAGPSQMFVIPRREWKEKKDGDKMCICTNVLCIANIYQFFF